MIFDCLIVCYSGMAFYDAHGCKPRWCCQIRPVFGLEVNEQRSDGTIVPSLRPNIGESLSMTLTRGAAS